MQYRLIERVRTRNDEKTGWFWKVSKTDGVDRIEPADRNSVFPMSSVFWQAPISMSDSDAIAAMLDNQKQTFKRDMIWHKHSYALSSEAFDTWKDNDGKVVSSDYDKVGVIPTESEVLARGRDDFDKWIEARDGYADMSDDQIDLAFDSYMACFNKENYLD